MWEKYSNTYKIVARLIQKVGGDFKEVEFYKDGHWGPRAMFCINHICEVVIVDPKLDNSFVW